MKNSFPKLYIEINEYNFVFYVIEDGEDNNFKIILKLEVQNSGIENNRISDYEKILNKIKENILLIEQKLKRSFKETVLIVENFNPTFLNLVGFKKLNGSQILRENITYILNNLKSYVDTVEDKKTLIHIFNSSFILDDKKIENPPVGLFGDFYSHELSFALINLNDFKNLQNIFANCNLKIKKILLKSFVIGADLSDRNKETETFFKIKINAETSKIFYFENDSLKFEQDFKFGNNIILRDISKVTSLKIEIVEKILNEIDLSKEIKQDDLIERKFFEEDNYIKIKKKLIYDIALARIEEILDVILFKNINLKNYRKQKMFVFYEIDEKIKSKSIKDLFKNSFENRDKMALKILDNCTNESLLKTANRIVHFGWKKEAIPTTHTKKTILARFFDLLFN